MTRRVVNGYTLATWTPEPGRRWPVWLCWLFGHEPTERSFRMCVTSCRCGAHQITDELVVTAIYPRRRGGEPLAVYSSHRPAWTPRRWSRFVRWLP